MRRRRSSSNGSAELLGPSVVDVRSAQAVDRPALGGGHEPGARVVRDARLGPLLEGGYEGLLSEVLRDADVPHQPRKAGDEPRGLDPPNGLDGAVDLGCAH
jgi:hypothetical protein